MEVDCVPFKETGYFSRLICDYLEQREELKPFFNRFPLPENFEGQIKEKQENYPDAHRAILVASLKDQYRGFEATEATLGNIASLEGTNTFTVVTGHQLNLFTGPLYFLYKIVSAINLAKQLKERYPNHYFVPVYWMATEDHDFEEINYFNLHGKKIQWNKKASGAVGRLSTEGLEVLFETLTAELGQTTKAERLKDLFRRAYIEHDNLAKATRFLANELFGDQGLVIVDGDDASLKQLLVPFAEKDIFEHTPFHRVTETIDALAKVSADYTIQVNPREINYFYLEDGLGSELLKRMAIFMWSIPRSNLRQISSGKNWSSTPNGFHPM